MDERETHVRFQELGKTVNERTKRLDDKLEELKQTLLIWVHREMEDEREAEAKSEGSS